MPIGSWAHAQYWRSGAPPSPNAATGLSAYPGWQINILLGSLFGGLQTWYERMRWTFRYARRVHRLTDERRAILDRAYTRVTAVGYLEARQCVTETAITLGFNKPTAWGDLKHLMQLRPDLAENAWRHQHAIWLLDVRWPNALTNPEKNFLIELAYQGYSAQPKRAQVWRQEPPP